jgi:hypothetical protein
MGEHGSFGMTRGAAGVDDGPGIVISGWIRMKCSFINKEFLKGNESLARRYALGDTKIHLGKVRHDLARVFQVVFVADEGPSAGVFENVLELSHSIKEVHWEDHSPDFRQGIVNNGPLYRVGHHQYTDISGVESCTNESMGQAIYLPV